MKIAVMTLTRDRLEYTQHCFESLRQFAGADYDHFVLDQGSRDGTPDWLLSQTELDVTLLPENIGIGPGLNVLLDTLQPEGYDVVLKYDNDCELIEPNTLRDVARLVEKTGWLLSPRILGLKNPPASHGSQHVGDELVDFTTIIGGIFLAAPATAYMNFRFPPTLPTWGYDDSLMCDRARRNGLQVGYVPRIEAWHYETSTGQEQRFPEYTARKLMEMAA